MIPVVLGLGSNCVLFSKPENKTLSCVSILDEAFIALKTILKECKMSPVYKTKAMYVTDQEDFFNAAVFGYFSGTAQELLSQTQQIEAKFGRNRKNEIRNGPRTLDIDIELFGNETINTKNLVVPHPKLHERQFILIPLLDVLPENADIPNRSVFKNYLKQLPDQGVKLYERND